MNRIYVCVMIIIVYQAERRFPHVTNNLVLAAVFSSRSFLLSAHFIICFVGC